MTRWRWRTTALLTASAVIVQLMFAAPASTKPDVATLTAQDIRVTSRRIATFRGSGANQTFGRLTFLGGISMTASSRNFGGFSGLTISPDGQRIVAVSDGGFWMTALVTRNDQGAPTGLDQARVGPLQARDGRQLDTIAETDAEGVTLVSGTLDDGEILIAFERIHRVGRFRVKRGEIEGAARYLKLPSYISGLKANRGLEAVGYFAAGRLKGSTIIFAEGRRDSRGKLRGWLIDARGRSREVFVEPIRDFDITDVAVTPAGDLLLLERRFRWSEGVQMRLRLVAGRDVASGGVMTGETLIEANGNDQIDNMEGLAVHQNTAGETIVTMISDDNFGFLQRNLLLEFRLGGK